MLYKDNLSYARRRLLESIVLVNGRVARVHEVTAGGFYEPDPDEDEPDLDADEVDGGKEFVVKSLSVEYANGTRDVVLPDAIDLTPIRTGYAKDDLTGVWYYVARVPARVWSQGLHSENTVFARNGHSGTMGAVSIGMAEQAHEGKYLSKEEAFKKGGAFSRNFCVEGDNLYYQSVRVAALKKGTIEWLPQWEYLKRRMERTE